MRQEIAPSFLALLIERFTDAALTCADELGASHASFHIVRNRAGRLRLRDGNLQGSSDSSECALGVRLAYDGAWEYAGTVDLTAEAAAWAADEAVAVALSCRALQRTPATLAEGSRSSGREMALVLKCRPVRGSRGGARRAFRRVERTAPRLTNGRARLGGLHGRTRAAVLRRCRQHDVDIAACARPSDAQRLCHRPSRRHRFIANVRPPSGRGWEYMGTQGWDWDAEVSELPVHLSAKARSRPVEPGNYDLVIDPSKLWLTLHETVGHATELDRALGYDASYAGTTFVTPEGVGSLKFGSPLMNVMADRTTEHGLATIGIDDKGVSAQSWFLVKDGVLVGPQTDRRTAKVTAASRSTGCSYAASALNSPLARLSNVSLEAAANGSRHGGAHLGGRERHLPGRVGWVVDRPPARALPVHGTAPLPDPSWVPRRLAHDLDRQCLLLTGLTSDGVYLIERGEVAAVLSDLRFNESPVELLARAAEIDCTEPSLSREWSDYFTRVAMSTLRMEGFGVSAVSE